LADLSGTV